MPAIMIDPSDMQPTPLPPSLVALDGRIMQGDLTEAQGRAAGWMVKLPIPPVAVGFERLTPITWVNQGDGTAAPAYTDTLIQDRTDREALQREANAVLADLRARHQAEDNAAMQADDLSRRQRVAVLQRSYAAATNLFCAVAGIDPVVNVLTMPKIAESGSRVTDIEPAMQLTQLALQLEALRTRLIEATGNQNTIDDIPLEGEITIPTE